MESNRSQRTIRSSTLILILGLATLPSQAGTRIYFVHNDHQGTPQALTDTQQRIVWRGDYRPFGAAAVDSDPDGDGQAVTLNVRLPGQYHDPSTGLYHNYYRDYAPDHGRYAQSDPVGLLAGPNTYAYVDGNPVRFSDPYGLCPWCVQAVIGAVTGGISSTTGSLATGAGWRESAKSGIVGAGFGAFAGGFGNLGHMGSSLLGGLSNLTAQAWHVSTDDNPCNDYDINVGAIIGSAIGSGWSSAITKAASQHSGPIATAFSGTVIGWTVSTPTGAVGAALGKSEE